jgi:hypothetical protein
MAQINKPSEHFNTKLYTGTASASGDTQAVTGVGFQPDWVWIKNRDGAYQHVLYDVVRGVNKEVRSAQNIAEVDSGTNGYLSAFDSDGFTTTRGTNTGNHVNVSGTGFVSWNWKAGGTASSNTDGSITSSASVNTTAGFSVITYTGTGSAATVGHGLGVAPSMIIVKNRDSAENWGVWHTGIDADEYLGLNQTGAKATNTAIWNNTLPTSSVFSVGNNARTGTSDDFIAYCFTEKKGYSKFGSYVGNNSADGTFVYTGFSPAYVLVKNTSAVAHWMVQDNRRSDANGDNPANKRMPLSDAIAEQTDSPIDLLSNGFKIRSTGSYTNDSGNIYVYMAFAEQPLVGTNNIPCTAR